jgi:hypothetical protein
MTLRQSQESPVVVEIIVAANASDRGVGARKKTLDGSTPAPVAFLA